MFGLPVPKATVEGMGGAPARYWGARAILHSGRPPVIDIVPDRQQATAAEGLQTQPIVDWVNNTGLPRLKESAEFARLSPSSHETLEVRDKQFTLIASPRGSYGYLYLAAFQYSPAGTIYGAIAPDPSARWVSVAFAEPPPVGALVTLDINGTWRGRVTGYFVEHGFQGIEVACSQMPDWRMKRDPRDTSGYFFGPDLTEVHP